MATLPPLPENLSLLDVSEVLNYPRILPAVVTGQLRCGVQVRFNEDQLTQNEALLLVVAAWLNETAQHFITPYRMLNLLQVVEADLAIMSDGATVGIGVLVLIDSRYACWRSLKKDEGVIFDLYDSEYVTQLEKPGITHITVNLTQLWTEFRRKWHELQKSKCAAGVAAIALQEATRTISQSQHLCDQSDSNTD